MIRSRYARGVAGYCYASHDMWDNGPLNAAPPVITRRYKALSYRMAA